MNSYMLLRKQDQGMERKLDSECNYSWHNLNKRDTESQLQETI